MNARFCWGLLVAVLLLPVSFVSAQSDQPPSARKVVVKVRPIYPKLARDMSLTGTVKLQVQVMQNGSAKTIQVKGGNPLLVQSAQTAVREWKWEKTDRETVEPVEFSFNP